MTDRGFVFNNRTPSRRLPSAIQRKVRSGAQVDLAQIVDPQSRFDLEQNVAAREGVATDAMSNALGVRPDVPPGTGFQPSDLVPQFVKDFNDTARGFRGVGDPVFDASRALPAAAPDNAQFVAERQRAFDTPLRGPQFDPSFTPDDNSAMARRLESSKQDVFDYARLMSQADQQIDELNRLRLQAVTEGADDIARQYDEQIAELEQDRAEAQRNMNQAMVAYEGYQIEAQAANTASIEAATAGQAAMQAAFEGKADDAVAGVEAAFDTSVEDVEAVADLIGTNNAAMGDSMESAVRQFEDMFKDAARDNIEDIDRIAQAGAKFATATANAVFADDAFMTEVEREKLEIELQSELDAMAEQIAKLKTDKAAAVKAAMDQYDPLLGFTDPAEAWSYVLENFGAAQGWDLDEMDAVMAIFGQLKNAGIRTRAGAAEWVAAQVAADNQEIMERWVLDNLPRTALVGGKIPVGLAPSIEAIAANPRSPAAAAARAQLAKTYGIDFDTSIFVDASEYENLLDTMDLWEDHNTQWANRKAVDAKKGRSAPNNWANRNTPAYVERRKVTVPNFVDDFIARFHPGASRKKFVGGEGYIRPASEVGGGKAANSDHQSGGAVDLYADTEAERKAIEAWANGRPDVSYVVYTGNSAHEGHHVHVSLLLGYRPATTARAT